MRSTIFLEAPKVERGSVGIRDSALRRFERVKLSSSRAFALIVTSKLHRPIVEFDPKLAGALGDIVKDDVGDNRLSKRLPRYPTLIDVSPTHISPSFINGLDQL